MSFLFKLDPREEASTQLIAHVGTLLRQSVEIRKSQSDISQVEIAKKLEVDRSRITKCLSGFRNMTLKTFSDVVWALGGEIELKIRLNPIAKKVTGNVIQIAATVAQPETNSFSPSELSASEAGFQRAAMANVVELQHAS